MTILTIHESSEHIPLEKCQNQYMLRRRILQSKLLRRGGTELPAANLQTWCSDKKNEKFTETALF